MRRGLPLAALRASFCANSASISNSSQPRFAMASAACTSSVRGKVFAAKAGESFGSVVILATFSGDLFGALTSADRATAAVSGFGHGRVRTRKIVRHPLVQATDFT